MSYAIEEEQEHGLGDEAEVIKKLLQCEDYAVRKKTASQMQKVENKTLLLNLFSKEDFPSFLCGLLQSETHSRSLQHMSRVLGLFPVEKRFSFGREQGNGKEINKTKTDLWNNFLSKRLFARGKSVNEKEELLVLSGLYLQSLLHLSDEEGLGDDQERKEVGDMVQRWAEEVGLMANADQPIGLREAASRSLILSEMLSVSEEKAKVLGVRQETREKMWFTVLKLLQDDDDEIRSSIASYLSTPSLRIAQHSLLHQDSLQYVSAPLSAPQATEVVFLQMLRIFRSSPSFLLQISSLLSLPSLLPSLPSPLLSELDSEVLAEEEEDDAFFAKELDNFWEERLQLRQLACFSLWILLRLEEATGEKNKVLEEEQWKELMERSSEKMLQTLQSLESRQALDISCVLLSDSVTFHEVYQSVMVLYGLSGSERRVREWRSSSALGPLLSASLLSSLRLHLHPLLHHSLSILFSSLFGASPLSSEKKVEGVSMFTATHFRFSKDLDLITSSFLSSPQ